MNHVPPNKVTRREFLQRAAVGAAGTALGLSPTGCSTRTASKRNIPLGLQLYSVRAECKANFLGTIEEVSKIGYQGVEFAGYWDRSAKEIRKMLDDNGLVTCGTHTSYESVLPDKIKETIEFNQIIGNKFVIVPYMTGKTRQEWLDKATLFNDLAEQLKPPGMWIGYHAHSHDFQNIEGESAWDTFFGNTKPEVIMQLDTSNCRDGGADPVEVLHKYPGRTRSIHLKPNGTGPEAIIGEDKINWQDVFDFCETKGNTQWYVIEHETSKNPLDTVRRTFEVLKKRFKV